MSAKDTFGLRMRLARERAGISLETIARETKVPISTWQAMERNDFSRWPLGVFARACIRDYCRMVGLDAEETVDEFCRWFSNGDRRAITLIRDQAAAIGVQTEYRDECLPAAGDRRAGARLAVPAKPGILGHATSQRAVGAVTDLVVVGATTFAGSQVFDARFVTVLGVVSLAYYSLAYAIMGRSPGSALVRLLTRRVPQLVTVEERRVRVNA